MNQRSDGASRGEGTVSRRAFFQQSGLGTLALAHLLQAEGLLAQEASPGGTDLRPRPGHFPARAKAATMRPTPMSSASQAAPSLLSKRAESPSS